MIKKIKIDLNNLYMFSNEAGEYVLLDTGIKCDREKIIPKITKKIGNINNIRIIIITHSHDDHIGNLKLLAENIKNENLTLISHIGGKGVLLSGKRNIPGGFYGITEFISRKIKAKVSERSSQETENLKKGKKIRENRKIVLLEENIKNTVFLDFEGYEEFSLKKYGFANLKVIYTPGHTMDSISLVYKDDDSNERYLFCGDTVQNLLWKKPLIPLFGDDIRVLLKSWRKIIEENYDRIYPATGKYVVTGDLAKVAKYEKNRV